MQCQPGAARCLRAASLITSYCRSVSEKGDIYICFYFYMSCYNRLPTPIPVPPMGCRSNNTNVLPRVTIGNDVQDRTGCRPLVRWYRQPVAL